MAELYKLLLYWRRSFCGKSVAVTGRGAMFSVYNYLK